MTSYQIVNANTSSEHGSIYIDITKTGKIRSIAFSVLALSGAVVGGLQYQVGSQATSQESNSNVRGVFGGVALALGTINTYLSVNHNVSGLNIGVEQGDRIYLGMLTSGTGPATATCRCIVNVDD